MKTLLPEPLTQQSFAPFGDVLETGRLDHPTYAINDGFTQRYHGLSTVQAEGEAVLLSIFETRSFGLPLRIKMLERHPLGSQSFIPIGTTALSGFYVVVARGQNEPDPRSLRAFEVAPGQGINFAAGIWHHPNIVRSGTQQFLVVDRADPASNLEEFFFPENWEAVELQV
jgi:ureidoglycolate lyase